MTDGTSASAVQINGAAPIWLRIRRSEPASGTGSSTFTTWYSTDRQIWRVLGSVSITMTRDAFVGLAVTSHKAGVETQAAFDDIRIQP